MRLGNRYFFRHGTHGFTMVELLVSLAIMGFFSTITIVNYRQFDERVRLTNFAYEVALVFREAQAYGVAVKEFGSRFDVSYGVNLGGGPSWRTSFRFLTLFADLGGSMGNKHYDGVDDRLGRCLAGPTSECVKVFVMPEIPDQYRIRRFCAVQFPTGPGLSGVEECFDTDRRLRAIRYISIVFTRPEPDAFIITNQNNAQTPRYQSARFYLVSRSGRSRVVEVTTTGQVSVLP